MTCSIAVVGAGITGLSTAVCAQERIPDLSITLISEKFSPHTTGDGSGGLWKPYCLKETSESDIVRWSSKTYTHMLTLWQSVNAGDVGVCLTPKYELRSEEGDTDKEPPSWSNIPVAYHGLDKAQVDKLTGSNKFIGGVHFITFTLQPSSYLPYLMNKFLQNGGKVQQRKVETLQELCGQYDAIINCTGLQARHLVGDQDVQPVRGQLVRVKAPWVFQMVSESRDGGNYIIPNMDCVVLGGTAQEGDWNTKPDAEDSRNILQGCYKLIPGLKEAEILSEWAGLRPSRLKVRLERDSMRDKNGKAQEVVHNYGHGGSGVTLSWGCAHEAVDILQDILNTKLKSKL